MSRYTLCINSDCLSTSLGIRAQSQNSFVNQRQCCRKRVPEAAGSGAPGEAIQGGKQARVQTAGKDQQAEDASLGNGATELAFKALAHHK